IEIELYFAFTPPQVIIRSPGHVRTYIMPPPFNTIQDYVNLFVRQWVDSAKLSMEVGKILRQLGQAVVDRIVQDHVLGSDVGHGDSAVLVEGHDPVAVQAATRVHTDWQRIDLREFAPSIR